MDYAVVYGTDAGYLPLVCFSIKSFAEIGGQLPEFLVLCDHEIPRAELEEANHYLERLGARVTFVPVELNRLQGVASTKMLPYAAYLRLLAPQLAPERFRRLLYLDGDTRVMQAFPSPLEVDLQGNPVGAVHDAMAIVAFWPDLQRDLGLKDRASYFNSGVMLIDRAEWLRRDCCERVLEFSRTWPERCRTADQCALNGVLASEWTRLDPRWNDIKAYWDQFAPTPTGTARRSEAYIAHFATERPWQKLRYGSFIEHHRWYVATAADSPWPDFVKRASAARETAIRLRTARGALRIAARGALASVFPAAVSPTGNAKIRARQIFSGCMEQNDPWAYLPESKAG